MHRRTTARLHFHCLCLALLCGALAGCTEGPAKVAWSFHRALLLRDCARALDLLSERTRAELARRAHAAAAASGGALPGEAATMICQGDLALYQSRDLSGRDAAEVEQIQVQEGATRAVVQVTLAGEAYPTTLVRESDAWRIELDFGEGKDAAPAG